MFPAEPTVVIRIGKIKVELPTRSVATQHTVGEIPMKILPWLLAIVVAGSTVSLSLAQGFPSFGLGLLARPVEPWTGECLGKPAYRESWNALFRGEKNVDVWLTHCAKVPGPRNTPTETVYLGGIPYLADYVFKVHDCGANFFIVLYTPNGAKAWGLLRKDYENGRFFGKPDDKKKHALRAMAKCQWETVRFVCK